MKNSILLFIVLISFVAALEPFNYKKLGEDWPGTCASGTRQSPININEGVNTEDDAFSEVEFDYRISAAMAE